MKDVNSTLISKLVNACQHTYRWSVQTSVDVATHNSSLQRDWYEFSLSKMHRFMSAFCFNSQHLNFQNVNTDPQTHKVSQQWLLIGVNVWCFLDCLVIPVSMTKLWGLAVSQLTTEAIKYVKVSAAMMTGSLLRWWWTLLCFPHSALLLLYVCVTAVKSCWRSLSYYSSNLHKLHWFLPREKAEKQTQLGRQLPLCNKGVCINTADSDPQFKFPSLLA